MNEKEIVKASLFLKDDEYDGINIFICFGEDLSMVKDTMALLVNCEVKRNIATIYPSSNNVFPLDTAALQRTMEKLRIVFPDTIFLTAVGMNHDETAIDEAGIKILTEANFVDFNMYVCYENGSALVYKAVEALPLYERLIEIYSTTELEHEKYKLELVNFIADEISELMIK